MNESKFGLKFWLGLVLFNATGLTNSLLANELDLLGCGNPFNGLQVLALYAGQFALSLAFPEGWTLLNFRIITRVAPFVVNDVVGNIAYWTALLYIGSGLTTVIYTAIVVFSALFQYLLFGKRLSYIRLLGIAGIMAFIALASTDQVQSNGNSGDVILGVLLAVAAAAQFGLNFVIFNWLMEEEGSRYALGDARIISVPLPVAEDSHNSVVDDAKSEEEKASSPMLSPLREDSSAQSGQQRLQEPQVQAILSLGVVPSLIYVLGYTVPYRQKLIYDEIDDKHYNGLGDGSLW
eukprot:CAMPEP_0167749134 /NCGR_PEP_ID=MMETSP0110_2-20121227/5230_1 /TAXON_ID=629695 /ORGANISM="Gymnochlora sp., Strain CCMP2014" /LENGTH=291 /DNA_ID=CAMNT_0007634237 /DNA_START=63 /DNA_END=935 /DNA_ORIENTATION=+